MAALTVNNVNTIYCFIIIMKTILTLTIIVNQRGKVFFCFANLSFIPVCNIK